MMFSPMPTTLEEAKLEILSWREMHRQQVPEIKQLRQDAKRYAFLRKYLSTKDMGILTMRGVRDEPDDRDSIDSAVDKAMQGGQQP